MESIFGWILFDLGCPNGTKLVSKWDQTSISQKTRKSAFGVSPLVPNWVQGVQVETKNRQQIDPTMESKMECILASIFERFCWILGAKLGGKIDQKSIRNRIEKKMQKTRPFGTRLGPSSGCQRGRDVLRPNSTRPDAPKILSRGAARAAALRAKILKLKRNSSYMF